MFALVALYMGYSFADLHRRNHRLWPAIVSRLSHAGAQSSSASEAYTRWHIFSDAGVLMELADYTERTAPYPDAKLLAEIRTGALQLRVEVLTSLMMRSRLL